MMKEGNTAAQIAKAMKLDLKTVKALMDGYNKMVPESFEIGTEKYLKHTVSSTPGQKAWNETVSKKAASMRETLAKVWEADVGKNVFEKDTNLILPGATVQIVGKDIGVVTDFDGNFEIMITIGDKIRVSYIGMKTTELSVLSSPVSIFLDSEDNELDEVT